MRAGVFLFFGALQKLPFDQSGAIAYDLVDYQTILGDFDDLIDIYMAVESLNTEPATVLQTAGFTFRPGCPPRKQSTIGSQCEALLDISLRHNLLQVALYQELVGEFGAGNVGVECLTRSGKVDLDVRVDDQFDLYEINLPARPECVFGKLSARSSNTLAGPSQSRSGDWS